MKLDYDTFVNSAYLRQGRADEFMLHPATERKQILADLLKLDQYQELADQAKDLSKQYQGQANQIELSLVPIKEKLSQEKDLKEKQKNLVQNLETLQLLQEQERRELQQLQQEENERKTLSEQFSWQQHRYQALIKDEERLTQEKEEINYQIKNLKKIIEQEDKILQRYQQAMQFQEEEKRLATQFKVYQEQQREKQQLEQQLSQETNQINLQIHQVKTQLESLDQQEKELTQILNNSQDVKVALERLSHHRERLQHLDKLQHQVAPLLQRKYSLQTKIEQSKANLKAQLEQLYLNEKYYLQQIDKIPEVRQSLLEIDLKLQELDKKQVYQKRVEEKGQERNEFQERLKENQRLSEEKIEELQEKLKKLEIPEAICPLCEQDLDETHRHHVITKTQRQQQETQEKIWILQEQMSVVKQELKILREEYKLLNQELSIKASLEQEYGQIEAELENSGKISFQLKETTKKIKEIEQLLTAETYAIELQSELTSLNEELQKLNYDEQTHALVRGEVERFRWAEIKQAKLDEASRRKSVILQQKPTLIEKINNLTQQKENLQNQSDIKVKINSLEASINQLGYQSSEHQKLLDALRQSQSWQLQYQQLQQAKQQYPQLQERYQTIEIRLQSQQQEKEKIQKEINQSSVKIDLNSNKQQQIDNLEKQIQNRRQKLDELLAQKGRLEQSILQLESLKKQSEIDKNHLKEIRKKYRVYQELAKAFGKNGIQALMIENVLPQLEAETNQILARLTANQLHIKFVTQKAGRSGNSRQKSAKLIDTLDILIADANMTRSYETYSGGEAFRINFSIRLALAKLLAQRAGTSLQMLIVDEGFGTQDTEGCDRLIAAINAISSDFSCILAVTHMPQFKEAFQYRIEVKKNYNGSQIHLVS